MKKLKRISKSLRQKVAKNLWWKETFLKVELENKMVRQLWLLQ